MKKTWLVIALSSIGLFSCGGSGGSGDSDNNAIEVPPKNTVAALSNTSWEKACSPYNKVPYDDSNALWNTKTRLSIDSSLKATYKTEYFKPKDTECNAMMFDTLDISRFEITGKVITEESIEALALNETFIFNSENSLPPNYTLIYINSEKLYFGQQSGDNLGETPDKRHSSISLDDYFTQVLN